MINPNMIRLEMNGGRFMTPSCEQHRSNLAQEEPSEPGYGTFLLSNDAPDFSSPGYSIDTRVSSVEDGFVQRPPISRKRKYIS